MRLLCLKTIGLLSAFLATHHAAEVPFTSEYEADSTDYWAAVKFRFDLETAPYLARTPLERFVQLDIAAQEPDYQTVTKRAFAQELRADVVAFYDTGTSILIQRSAQDVSFTSETAFLEYLSARGEPKNLLVVILSKRHHFTNPEQSTFGFWEACKKCGFKHVSIQQARTTGRPILYE